MNKPHAWWIAIVVCALAGAAIVLYATTLGVGVSPDSTVYLNGARRWLIRFGFPFALGNTSNWIPPGYPMLLLAGSLLSLGTDPAVIARWLDALFFAANIALVGLMLHLALPRSVWIPLGGAWLMLTSVTMLGIQTMAWSEPPFLFVSLSGLTLLAFYLERPRALLLIFTAGAIAASLLIRYVGVALVMTGIVAILVLDKRVWKRRGLAAAIFALLATAPLIVWSLTHPSGRQLAWHGTSSAWFFSGILTIANWFFPAETLRVPNESGLAMMFLFTIGAVILLAARKVRARPIDENHLTRSHAPALVSVLTLYLFFYALVMLFTRLAVDAGLPLDERTLAPLFPIVLILVLYLAQQLMYATSPSYRLKYIFGGIALAMSALYFFAAMQWVEQSHRQGQWYASVKWRQSKIMARVNALSPTTQIYSNADDAIIFLTSRDASRLPDKVRLDTQLANPKYAREVQEIGKRLAGNAVIVYLHGFEDRLNLPTEQEAVAQWNLSPLVSEADGTIYRRLP